MRVRVRVIIFTTTPLGAANYINCSIAGTRRVWYKRGNRGFTLHSNVKCTMGNNNATVSATDTKPAGPLTAAEARLPKNSENAAAKLSRAPRRSGSLLRRNATIRNSMRKQRPMGLYPRRNFLLRRKSRAPLRQPLTHDEKEYLAAAGRGDLRTVRDLLGNGVGLETSDANEMTALHHASKHARDDVIRYLLKQGANANASDLTGGFSPLHWVIINSCPPMGSKNYVDESIIALARGGCDLNATDFNLATPLHIAAQKGHKSTIDTLVRLGANPLAVDVMGRSCVQLAKSDAVKEFIESLHDNKESVVYHVLEAPVSRSPSPPALPPPVYHVLEGPISRSPSPPTLPSPTKKPRLSLIDTAAHSSGPTLRTDSTLLLRNLPQFHRRSDSPGYPAPPPPQSPAYTTPLSRTSSRNSTPEYSVVDIPRPHRYRPLPLPPTQVPSPLYRYKSTYSTPVPPPPPHTIAKRRGSRKMTTTNASIRRHRKYQNY